MDRIGTAGWSIPRASARHFDAAGSQQIYKKRELASAAVADYINAFYNRTRRHSHLGGLSPEQFEAAHKPRRQRFH